MLDILIATLIDLETCQRQWTIVFLRIDAMPLEQLPTSEHVK
jgi:hypothetical protein